MAETKLRIILEQLVKHWAQRAGASGAIAMSARSAYSACAKDLEEALEAAQPQPAGPERRMDVKVFGPHARMTEDALDAGREFFTGMDVTLASLHVRLCVTAEERALALAAGEPGRAGLAQVRAGHRAAKVPA